MFEKSLVDLIRGLRGHKGNEAEYIQSALKECRSEIRSQDMDVKATALLKLIYLEMFGYDMTWAAFNVLEVMASAKQLQKRVGYLAAMQSFGPETEVLMLAENLLKKDLTSPSIPTLTLPLVTLPHLATPSLALSILNELLPRLSHSQPTVRKKTIVTLYRLALVYPETLRVAWPKLKERLLDEQENSSVTAATVNVVCELGWRRPQDFLALAPRLFDLLISDKNNWMAIKIIKLFAVLTPLEPRLVKKLVRPLTKILQETGAMSLLYECISGIIQGGILDGSEVGVDVDEVADLCITKLRGMIVVEGDPNLKYVALLAFNKIVGSHPALVSRQQDVIMACLDDPDISIKMQALELVCGMVNSENLQDVVDRLMKQLANAAKSKTNEGDIPHLYDPDNTDLEQKLVPDKRSSEVAPLPDEYRHDIVSRILEMCSSNTYANISDFEWYIDILVHIVRHLPAEKLSDTDRVQTHLGSSLGSQIGRQILDIVVRVKELRSESVKAAETLVLLSNRQIIYASHAAGQSEVLASAAWVCGEFASYLSSPYEVLNSMIHDSCLTLASTALSTFAHAIPKLISRLAEIWSTEWNASRSSTLSLILARTIDFLEKLSSHASLEVQERSVEFLELLKVASEALSSQPTDATEAPLLLTSAIPNLFLGMELNPVASAAQKKVPLPSDLDLDAVINPDLSSILQASQIADAEDPASDAFDAFYHEREIVTTQTSLQSQPTSITMYEPEPPSPEAVSYQSAPLDTPNTLARRKAERLARAKDDPFYIATPGGSGSGRNTPIHEILRSSNGGPEDLDIDSIPIIDLQIDTHHDPQSSTSAMLDEARQQKRTTTKKKPVRKFVVAVDETLDLDPTSNTTTPQSATATPQRSQTPQPQLHNPSSQSTLQGSNTVGSRPRVALGRGLLSVDSSSLNTFALEGSSSGTETEFEIQRREAEAAEMAAALAEVERKRLQMQREIEARQTALAEGVAPDGTAVVKRKKKKKKVPAANDALLSENGDGNGVGRDDIETHGRAVEEGNGEGEDGTAVVKKKKKKKVKSKDEVLPLAEREAEVQMQTQTPFQTREGI